MPLTVCDINLFLHRNSLRESCLKPQIHVQIMRFKCLNMAFNLTKPIWALICLHDATLESVAALTDHFTDVFVHENVARVYVVGATL